MIGGAIVFKSLCCCLHVVKAIVLALCVVNLALWIFGWRSLKLCVLKYHYPNSFGRLYQSPLGFYFVIPFAQY